jgi:hypothetical protein
VPALVAYGLIPEKQTILIHPPDSSQNSLKEGYVYFGYVNTVFGYGVINPSLVEKGQYNSKPLIWEISETLAILNHPAKIYANGESQIWCLR